MQAFVQYDLVPGFEAEGPHSGLGTTAHYSNALYCKGVDATIMHLVKSGILPREDSASFRSVLLMPKRQGALVSQ